MALKPAKKFLAEQKQKRKKARLRKKRRSHKPTSEDKRYDAIGKAMEDYPNVHGVRRRGAGKPSKKIKAKKRPKKAVSARNFWERLEPRDQSFGAPLKRRDCF